MKTSLTTLATIFAAAIFTVSSTPPNIGRGNYVYDSNSIPQNEKILKLFVRLAAHTANRLIRLKLKVNPQILAHEIYEDEINVEPERLFEKSRDKSIHPISMKPYEQSRRSFVIGTSNDELRNETLSPNDLGTDGEYHRIGINENEQPSAGRQFEQKDSELPSTSSEVNFTGEERSNNPENEVTDDPVNRLLEDQRAIDTRVPSDEVVTNGSNRQNIPDETIYDNEILKNESGDVVSHRKVPEADPTADNVVSDIEFGDNEKKLKYNDDETRKQSELSEYTESSIVNNFINETNREPYLADEEVELDSDSTIIPVEVTTVKSLGAIQNPSLKPRVDLSDNVAVTEEPKEGDVELENRALFNIEKKNYVTHYTDQSTNINRADTTVTNSGLGQSGRVIVNQNAGSRPFERLEQVGQRGKIFVEGRESSEEQEDGLGQKASLASDVVVNQIAGSSSPQRIIGVDHSMNENQATTMVGDSIRKNSASASLGFEKNIGLGIGIGMNRESMGVKNSANMGQMSTSSSRGAAEARAEATIGFTDGMKRIQKSGGAGIALQKELALHVQPKHSLTAGLLGGIMSTWSQTKGSAEDSVKVNEENSGILHGEFDKGTQTRGSTNMDFGNSMQGSTIIGEENAGNLGGVVSDIGSRMKGSADMNVGSLMQDSVKVSKENSGILHGKFDGEIQTRGSGNMDLENSMQGSIIIRKENVGNLGGVLGTVGHTKGSSDMGLDNSMQGSTRITEKNANVLEGKLNSQMTNIIESKMHESMAKKHEHEMHSYASRHEAYRQGSMSKENSQVGYEKSAHLVPGSLAGEASHAEKKLREDGRVTMNQGTGLNLGAHIGINLQHGTSLSPSLSERNRVVSEDLHSSMNGGANFGGGSAIKVEASKELSATGFGLLNSKKNLLHRVLNPVGKFSGKLDLAAQVLGIS